MSPPLGLLTDPLVYPFMRYGLIEVVLLGIASGLMGVFIVQRQLTFFAHSLSHTIFPAVVVAAALSIDVSIGALVGAAISLALVARLGRQRDVGHTGAVGIVLVVLFALGVVLVGVLKVRSQDLGASLIGNVIGVSTGDIVLSAGLVALVAIALRFLFWPMVLCSFDETAARALGLPVALLDLVLLAMVAVTATVSVRVVGVILTVAVLVVPAATALRWTRNIKMAMLVATLIGAGSGIAGLYVSYYVPVAPAAIIVLMLTAAFGLSTLTHMVAGQGHHAARLSLPRGDPEGERYANRFALAWARINRRRVGGVWRR